MSKILGTVDADADADAMFDSFDIEELGTMEFADGVALPEMAASTAHAPLCCSSSSSACC
ncbi:thiopeptide-type bacteriocin [Streptomyces sp. MMBL 11-1]|uniref:thiopeptide-type bacteriocin n=1 Tax=Streptomyces sp. MMBL 11-1 TaxID=3026420 RepID=UPI00235ED9B1|nr:thiopeptide-type bacteriocin [Streptomyces sp. MMBL 11-1]